MEFLFVLLFNNCLVQVSRRTFYNCLCWKVITYGDRLSKIETKAKQKKAYTTQPHKFPRCKQNTRVDNI